MNIAFLEALCRTKPCLVGNGSIYDLEELNLNEYKNLDPRWCDWQAVKKVCAECATLIFDRIIGAEGESQQNIRL